MDVAVLTVEVTSTEQTSQWYWVPASVPRDAVFFRITPIDRSGFSSSNTSECVFERVDSALQRPESANCSSKRSLAFKCWLGKTVLRNPVEIQREGWCAFGRFAATTMMEETR